MTKLYNHTYWDGTTAERATSRKTFRSRSEPDHEPEFIGPPTPLQKALIDLAHFYRNKGKA